MKSLLCLLLVETLLQSLSVGGVAAPEGVIYAAAPEERGAFYVGGKNGVYNYGYNTGDGIAKVEVRHPDGSVTGSYRYFDPLGRQILRSYIADKRGFRVLGNDLPVAPNTPAIGLVDAHVLTGPVEGTQEFSIPNIVTPHEKNLIFQNVGVKRTNNAADNALSQLQQKIHIPKSSVTEQHKGVIRQQEIKLTQLKNQYKELLRKQERELAQLKNIQRQTEPRQNVQMQNSNYWLTKTFGYDSPYFYSADNFKYDFPAGFGYNVGPSSLGPTARDASLFIAAEQPYNVRNAPKHEGYRHPFVAGHSR